MFHYLTPICSIFYFFITPIYMNDWLLFVKNYKEKHPNLSYKDCLVNCKIPYAEKKKTNGKGLSSKTEFTVAGIP